MTQAQATDSKSPSNHRFDPEILRAYDIRGIVGQNLSETDAYFVGRTFGTYVRRQSGNESSRKKVCLGFDGRTSSPKLADEVSRGLADSGVDVERVGLGPTPMVYFAVKDTVADGGIMITGSHNPPAYNGFKMTLQKSPVFGDAIQELGRIAAEGDFECGQGQVSDHDVIDSYVKRLVNDLSGQRSLKIAWDAGNGASGPVLRELVKHLPGEHILLYDEVDGLFPAHHPDPTVDENLADLRSVVINQNCDFGVAFDGDGDRIGIVDEKGQIIRSDVLLALYAREILTEHPGSTIIGDVKCSVALFNEIEKYGGKSVICATGHSILKNKLIELKAPLAGELSGHIFFADKYYGFDDALYCTIRLMNLVQDDDISISDLVADMPNMVNTPEIRFDVDESKKFSLVDGLVNYFQEMSWDKGDDWHVIDVDGIRLNTPQGWLLIRASNTQNVISMRIEAMSVSDMKDLLKMVETALENQDLDGKEILAQINEDYSL